MDWRLKCAAFHLLRAYPKGLTALQRHITRTYFTRLTPEYRAIYERHVADFKGGVAFEFGAGGELLAPLLLSKAGASKVYAYDMFRLATVERVNHIIRQIGGPSLSTIDDLSRLYRIEYRAPADATMSGLPDASVDFIYSTDTFEHLKPCEIAPILTECLRIAKPCAIFSFGIDYHDHYVDSDARISPFNFYRYGDRAWRLMNPALHYQNRLRHSDFVRAFAEAGLTGADERVVRPMNGARVHPRFAGYARHDLETIRGHFRLHGPASRQAPLE